MSDFEFDSSSKLSFKAEWFDPDAGRLKHFYFTFYPYDRSVELFDTDLKRQYLKRTVCDNISSDDVFIGNTVRIFGRKIELMQYGDSFTRKYISKAKEHTLAVVKPGRIDKLGEIINDIYDKGFQIFRMQMGTMSKKEALEFYSFHEPGVELASIIELMVSGHYVAIDLIGFDAVVNWKRVLGDVDPVEARKINPESFRARYGVDVADNAFHGASNHEQAIRETEFFFSPRKKSKPIAEFGNSTCCVVKPHVLREKKLGNVLTSILGHGSFTITALKMTSMTDVDVEEFLEVYKGVIQDFHAMKLSFLDGPCVALEISGKNSRTNVHEEFRKFSGPVDSSIAKQIRPNTLRAVYGVDKYKNAIHCTDLAEDTVLELQFFFDGSG